MKKFLIGCLGVFVVLAAVGGFLAYRYVIQPLTGVVQSVEQFAQIAELDKGIRNQAGFQAPADGVISEAQLERYMAVQAGMQQRLDVTLEQLNERYRQIDTQGREPNFRELMVAYQDLLKLVLEAKRVQVDELNAHNFSLAEYSWVKREAIRAVGIPLATLDLTQLTGESVNLPELTSTVPEANIKLLEPFRETLEENFALAFFGL